MLYLDFDLIYHNSKQFQKGKFRIEMLIKYHLEEDFQKCNKNKNNLINLNKNSKQNNMHKHIILNLNRNL